MRRDGRHRDRRVRRPLRDAQREDGAWPRARHGALPHPRRRRRADGRARRGRGPRRRRAAGSRSSRRSRTRCAPCRRSPISASSASRRRAAASRRACAACSPKRSTPGCRSSTAFTSSSPTIRSSPRRPRRRGVSIRDVRKTGPRSELHFWSGEILAVGAPRIAVLGTDCALGKRTTARFLLEACRAVGLATELDLHGADRLDAGRALRLRPRLASRTTSSRASSSTRSCPAGRRARPELILLEGQSALRNPSGPCGSEFLVSARAAGVILQHAPGRVDYEGLEEFGLRIPPVADEIDLIRRYGARTLAVTLNGEGMSPEALRRRAAAARAGPRHSRGAAARRAASARSCRSCASSSPRRRRREDRRGRRAASRSSRSRGRTRSPARIRSRRVGNVVVRIETDTGLVGLGAASPERARHRRDARGLPRRARRRSPRLARSAATPRTLPAALPRGGRRARPALPPRAPPSTSPCTTWSPGISACRSPTCSDARTRRCRRPITIGIKPVARDAGRSRGVRRPRIPRAQGQDRRLARRRPRAAARSCASAWAPTSAIRVDANSATRSRRRRASSSGRRRSRSSSSSSPSRREAFERICARCRRGDRARIAADESLHDEKDALALAEPPGEPRAASSTSSS